MAFQIVTDFAAGDPLDAERLNKILDNILFLYAQQQSLTSQAVPNFSFEIDNDVDGVPDEWTWTAYTGGTIAMVNSKQHSGTKSVAITHPGGASNGGGYITTTDFIPVGKSEHRFLSFAIETTVAGMDCRAHVLWYDKDLSLISTDIVYASTANPTSAFEVKHADKDTGGDELISPSTAVYAKIRLFGGHSDVTTGGTAYFDTVYFGVVPRVPVSKRRFFSSSDTMVVPPGVTTLYFTMQGGGGGGGGAHCDSIAAYASASGGGGGGGGMVINFPQTVTPGDTITVTVGGAGSGGAAGTNGPASDGTAGGNSSVAGTGFTWTATGGGAGGGGTSGVAGTGGAAGTGFNSGGSGTAGATSTVLATELPGGNGGTTRHSHAGDGGSGGVLNANLNGDNANGWGGGGGGGGTIVGSPGTFGEGGDGSPGFVLIEW
jgi:hypothetical protein